jgi:hypothetical protein
LLCLAFATKHSLFIYFFLRSNLFLQGAAGVLLYNRLTRRWRTFGNANEERAIRCVGVTWYGEHVVVLASEGHAQYRRLFHAGELSKLCALDKKTKKNSKTKTTTTTKTKTSRHFGINATNADGMAAKATSTSTSTSTLKSTNQKHELLFFPRTHLALSSLLLVKPLRAQPTSVQAKEQLLSVHLKTGQVGAIALASVSSYTNTSIPSFLNLTR